MRGTLGQPLLHRRCHGSSPPVRGTHPGDLHFAGRHRFIPARAGNSRAELPRAARHAGSSPPVRGTRGRSQPLVPRLRFIPARAGNSSHSNSPATLVTVHPRPCGELSGFRDSASVRAGSSPPVRGTLPVDGLQGFPDRFIPARAGNSRRAVEARTPRPVHPRPCGELGAFGDEALHRGGSSPPVRGTQDEAGVRHGGLRFIPARAGNSRLSRIRLLSPAVHPRPCGELFFHFPPSEIGAGSSPPVRGTRSGQRARGGGPRFIPARAGNSTSRAWPGAPATVHPRPCGELRNVEIVAGKMHGSSPPVRGTLRDCPGGAAPERFIPARAGNSLPATYQKVKTFSITAVVPPSLPSFVGGGDSKPACRKG